MPGTIQVSVLDLIGLPSSSTSVKVSIGKREYKMWGKGDFSFPVTTLRDNLIVTLVDMEGNELSRTGIDIKLVVEKGFWDDLFPLEGGGQVHMKLLFILSEGDLKRIREVRLYAVKKKQEELLANSVKRLEAESVARVAQNVIASFNHEVTDSRDSAVRREAVSVGGTSPQGPQMSIAVSRGNYPDSGREHREEFQLEHTIPNKRGEEVESLQEHKVLRLAEARQQITKKNDVPDTHSPPYDVPDRPIFLKGAVGYPKTLSKSEMVATESTSTAPTPFEEHKGLHLMESTGPKFTKQISYTRSPASDFTTRSNYLQTQTHSAIEQIRSKETPMENETDREMLSTEATQQEPIDTQSLPNDTTRRPNFSNIQTNRAAKQFALDRTPQNNETDKGGALSEATQQKLVKFDIQPPPNDISTRPYFLQNQTHSRTEQITVEKSPKNDETDKEGASSLEAKLSQELKTFQHTATQQTMEKADSQLLRNVVPTGFLSSKDALQNSAILLNKNVCLASSPLEKGHTLVAENQTAAGKTLSNVRKMICALESSLPQGPLSHANGLKLQHHLSNVKREVPSKGPSMNEANMESFERKTQIVERDLNTYLVRKPADVNVQQSVPQLNKVKTKGSSKEPTVNGVTLEHTETNKQIIEDELDSLSSRIPLNHNMQLNVKYEKCQKQIFDAQTVRDSDKLPILLSGRQLEVLDARAAEGNDSGEHVDNNVGFKRENMNRQATLSEENAITSDTEMATVSGRVLDDPVSKKHTHTVHHEQQGSAFTALEESEWRKYRDDSDTVKITGRGTSLEKQKSVEYPGGEQSKRQFMRSWILPDEGRQICVTTASKQMMDLVECLQYSGESNPREFSIPRTEVVKEVAKDTKHYINENEAETTSQSFEKSKLERSGNDGFSGGFVQQVVKIATMVALGTLVVVASQIRNR